MKVPRRIALYIDHVICLLSLNVAGALRTVKHRYTPNISIKISTAIKMKTFYPRAKKIYYENIKKIKVLDKYIVNIDIKKKKTELKILSIGKLERS